MGISCVFSIAAQAKRPNGPELSCPAEPGGSSITLLQASRRFKPQVKRRPPGQSKILVIVQGFSELLGSPWRHLKAPPLFDLMGARSRALF